MQALRQKDLDAWSQYALRPRLLEKTKTNPLRYSVLFAERLSLSDMVSTRCFPLATLSNSPEISSSSLKADVVC